MPKRILRISVIIAVVIGVVCVGAPVAKADLPPCCTLKWTLETATYNTVICNWEPICLAFCIETEKWYTYDKLSEPCEDNYVVTYEYESDCEKAEPDCPCDPDFLMYYYHRQSSLCSRIDP